MSAYLVTSEYSIYKYICILITRVVLLQSVLSGLRRVIFLIPSITMKNTGALVSIGLH